MRVTEIVRQKALIRNLILAISIFFGSLVVGTLIGQDRVRCCTSALGIGR
jgi:hypothetical protein